MSWSLSDHLGHLVKRQVITQRRRKGGIVSLVIFMFIKEQNVKDTALRSKGKNGKNNNAGGTADGMVTRLRQGVISAMLLVTVLFNLSRVAALAVYYRGPEAVAYSLHQHLLGSYPKDGGGHQSEVSTIVCVGRDWYKFPSSFFLPHAIYSSTSSTTFHYRFANEHGFDGALPLDFAVNAQTGLGVDSNTHASASCAAVPPGVNDLNRHVPGSMILVTEMTHQCDYFFGSAEEISQDLLNGRSPQANAQNDLSHWSRIRNSEVRGLENSVLSPSETPTLCRILFVPYLSHKCVKWLEFSVWKNTAKHS